MDTKRIYFEKEENFPQLPMIGIGSQGTVYKWNDVAIKLFDFDLDNSDRDLKKFEYFQSIEMKDIAFPKKLIFIGDNFYGYTMPLFDGADLNRSPFKKSFELLKKSIVHNEKNEIQLSNYKIKLYDMYTANLIFLRNFKFIDCDSYMYSSSFSNQECLDYNHQTLNYVYHTVIVEGLGLATSQKLKLFRSFAKQLQDDKISPLEYVDKVQQRISEIADEEVLTLSQGAKVLKKVRKFLD